MKLFTSNDIIKGELDYACLNINEISDLLESPLAWQKRGLQQTRSGYGAKLTSVYKISFNGKLYRLYNTCYSNAGSVWFISNKQKIFVN